MFSVFICEDQDALRNKYETIIKNQLLMNDYDMFLKLSTHNPNDILEVLKKGEVTEGIYFLDIDLQQEINGVELAQRIRQYDPYGKIVFLTSYPNYQSLVFEYEVEAYSYLIKDNYENIQEKLSDLLKNIHQRLTIAVPSSLPTFKVKIGHQTRIFPMEEILFFETAPIKRKVVMHHKNGLIDFYHSLDDLSKISPDFFKCHKSFVVNIQNIKEINASTKEAIMINDEKCWISARKIKELIKKM